MKFMKRNFARAFVILSLFAVTGCGSWMGNLRRDLDDTDPSEKTTPTVGGNWTERGYLNDSDGRYASVGHSERNPASGSYNGNGDGWLNDESRQANARDRYRNQNGEDEEASGEETGTSFSSSPSMAPTSKQLYKNGSRATRADFIDESPNEGSLWASDGQTNYYFTKNKIRGVGDIVNITMEEPLVKDAMTEVGRTLTPREKVAELALAQERIRQKVLADNGLGPVDPNAKDKVKTSAAAPVRAPAKTKDPAAQEVTEEKPEKKTADELEYPQAKASDIDVSKSLDIKAGETMLAEIVERYPNGNYKVRGTKKIRYRNGFKFINLVGVVRGSDIGEDDTVTSGKLYEYRLESLR